MTTRSRHCTATGRVIIPIERSDFAWRSRMTREERHDREVAKRTLEDTIAEYEQEQLVIGMKNRAAALQRTPHRPPSIVPTYDMPKRVYTAPANAFKKNKNDNDDDDKGKEELDGGGGGGGGLNNDNNAPQGGGGGGGEDVFKNPEVQMGIAVLQQLDNTLKDFPRKAGTSVDEYLFTTDQHLKEVQNAVGVAEVLSKKFKDAGQTVLAMRALTVRNVLLINILTSAAYFTFKDPKSDPTQRLAAADGLAAAATKTKQQLDAYFKTK